MPSLLGRVSVPRDWKQALLSASLASLAYASLFIGYSLISSTVQISGSVVTSFWLAVVFAFGTIGIPILFWICYQIRGPSIVMSLVLLFWHVLIHLPVLGSDGGDVPAFALVLFWAPFYLVAYGLIAGGEYWLRGRNISASAPSM